MADWVLMAVLATFVGMMVFAVSTAFYVSRYEDARLEFQERLAQANMELVAQRQMLADTAMKARVLDAVPVARLLEDSDG